jgi:hypothetical protein
MPGRGHEDQALSTSDCVYDVQERNPANYTMFVADRVCIWNECAEQLSSRL